MFPAGGWVIIAIMSTVMIVLILLVVLVVAVSLMLGRVSYEVQSARDTEFVELEGRWVRYGVTGGGPPVVLVHGWLSSSRVWDQIVPRLSQRFTVYTLDLAGFGESDKPTGGYGARYGSRLLYAFCAHFGLARATIVGHDLSGAMAVKLAADHPDIVGRLVLVATPADEEQIDLPTLLWLGTLPVVGPIFYTLGRYLKPVRKLWLRSFVHDPKDLPDGLVEDAGKPTPAAASKAFNVTRHEISGGRVARQARIIKVPILLIAGEDDQIIDPRAVSDWGQNAAQAEIALLDGCGHLPMVESSSEFSARLLAFLTGDEGYLEYVKEVPQPVRETPIEEAQEEDVEKPDGSAPPEETTPHEGPPADKPPEKSTPAAPSSRDTFFGDLDWDFSPDRAPSTSRKTPAEEAPVSAETPDPAPDEDEVPPPRRPPRKATPLPKNRDDVAEQAEPRSKNRKRAPRRPSHERRSGGTDAGSARIPEFPDDLFQWSQPPDRGQGSREDPRRRKAAGDDSEGGR